jgi:uncharacterized protein (DUF779 family)
MLVCRLEGGMSKGRKKRLLDQQRDQSAAIKAIDISNKVDELKKRTPRAMVHQTLGPYDGGCEQAYPESDGR